MVRILIVPDNFLTDAWLGADAGVFTLDNTGAVVELGRPLVPGLQRKAVVVAATTSAGTLASDFENGDTVDGVVLATGNRILIKDQATASENGIYVVAASGAPTRATDSDTGAELQGAVVYVSGGTVNAETTWVANRSAITLGSTSIVWSALVAIAGTWIKRPLRFGATIPNPSTAEDVTLGYADKACTITKIAVVVRGTSPSVTWTLRKGSDRSAAGTEIISGGTTTTSQAGVTITTFTAPALAAGEWLWLETSATSGTVQELSVVAWAEQTAP